MSILWIQAGLSFLAMSALLAVCILLVGALRRFEHRLGHHVDGRLFLIGWCPSCKKADRKGVL